MPMVTMDADGIQDLSDMQTTEGSKPITKTTFVDKAVMLEKGSHKNHESGDRIVNKSDINIPRSLSNIMSALSVDAQQVRRLKVDKYVIERAEDCASYVYLGRQPQPH